MFKDISPDDRSIKDFKTFKQFTFTNADSGSGVFGLEGLSGSFHNFQTGSSASQSYGVFNEASQSQGKHYSTFYSDGTFYKIPVYYQIRNCYYQYDRVPNPKSATTRFPLYSGGNWSRKYPYGREDWGSVVPRELHGSVNVITIPQEFYGEEIKPYSVQILDDSSEVTLDLRDDGRGQLYDWAYSSSYSAGTPDASTKSGSAVGNVFYEHGIITITDTGSYTDVGLGTAGNGWEVTFQATKTSTEYSYLCNVNEYQFNGTTNPSVVVGRSGSITIPENARYSYNGKFGDDAQYENTKDLVLPAGSGSYGKFYNPGTEYKTFTTHSEFGTYVTNIGLYNDTNELLAIAKISNPIKNDKDLPLSFLVRFDS